MPVEGSVAAGASVFFAATLGAAAVEDIRHLRIPNRLVLGLALGAPAFHLSVGSTPGAVAAAALVGLAILSVGLLLFARGLVGGGDVKLAAATALWLGPAGSAGFLGYMAISGALIALALLALRARRPEEAARGAMPYGVAIAAGGLAAFAETRLGWL